MYTHTNKSALGSSCLGLATCADMKYALSGQFMLGLWVVSVQAADTTIAVQHTCALLHVLLACML